MFDEILKLDKMLTEADIPHTLSPFSLGMECYGYQIRIYADTALTKEIDDCVCHTFSHGYALGLLETFKLGDCVGFETAERVFEGWQKMYAKALGE